MSTNESDEQEAKTVIDELLREGTIDARMRDAEETPLLAVTFDPDEADEAGFFIETAITPEEAEDAALDT